MPIDNSSRFPKPLAADLLELSEGMAIVIDGDTAPKAITAGQYLFIKNHSTLATGGYHATAAIASGASITSSNVAADTDGIVNGAVSKLNGNLASINTKLGTNVVYRGSEVATGKNSCTVDTSVSYTRALKGCGIVLLELRITCSTFSSETVIATLNSAIRPFADVTYIKTFDMWGTEINGNVTIRSGGDISAQPNCSGKNIQIVVTYPVVP